MEAVIVLVFTFGLLWVLFILPQQRRVRAHQQLVRSLDEGDEVVLTAGIFGRITRLGPEELDLEVAPGVELRVARQAVLRRVEDVRPTDGDGLSEAEAAGSDEAVEGSWPTDAAEAAELSEAETPRIDIDDAGDNNAQRPGGNSTL